MKKIILLCACLLCLISAMAQNAPEVTFVEDKPRPNYDYNAYLSSHLVYPYSCRKNNIEGKTTVKFIVNEDGHISDVTVLKSSGNEELDHEAVRVVETFPAWKPGKRNGEGVKVYFTLPIIFNLQNKDVKNPK